jgi:hypothetical protein
MDVPGLARLEGHEFTECWSTVVAIVAGPATHESGTSGVLAVSILGAPPGPKCRSVSGTASDTAQLERSARCPHGIGLRSVSDVSVMQHESELPVKAK